jgi:hypothetical protein
MRSPKDTFLEAIAVRATHDQDMRAMLREMGIDPTGSLEEVSARLRDLDGDTIRELRTANADLEARTGRRADLYYGLNYLAEQRWAELMHPLKEQAKAMEKDIKAARDALQSNNNDRFETLHEKIEAMSTEIIHGSRDSRGEVRRDLRRHLSKEGADLDSEARKIMVDQVSNMLAVPKDVRAAMVISDRLIEERAALERKRERELSPQATPRITPSPMR